MIRVLLVEDHHLVRQGIRLLLERTDDIEIVAEAKNGNEAINLAKRMTPDVLITNINGTHLNGIQAAKQIRGLGLETRVVILSLHSDAVLIQQALCNGVKGYLPKCSVTKELLLAIRTAYRGEMYLSPAIFKIALAEHMIEQVISNPSHATLEVCC